MPQKRNDINELEIQARERLAHLNRLYDECMRSFEQTMEQTGRPDRKKKGWLPRLKAYLGRRTT